jgi:hypothetical protein
VDAGGAAERACYRAAVSPPRAAFSSVFALALALALPLLAACRSHPAPPADAPPPLDRAQCTTLASSAALGCVASEKDVLGWCISLGHLAEVAACAPQARRAFDCAARVAARCKAAACCSSSLDCADAETALDHCARGYCGGHGANPDCRWTAQRIDTPVSLLAPPAPAPASLAASADSADLDGELVAALDAGIRKIDDTHYEVSASLVEKVLQNPMAVAKSMRVVPAMKDGQPDGFKLYAIRPSSLWARLGLANGDTIQAVNGMRLESADKALEVYTSLREARALELDLVRRGRPLRLFIAIKE